MRICKNLATIDFCQASDDSVRDELATAKIPILKLPFVMNGEVKTRYIGLLNGFCFFRQWRYWCVEGLMPLENAKQIYEEISFLGVRAGGDCTNPEPETVAVDPYFDAMLQEEANRLSKTALSSTELIEKLKEIQPEPGAPKYVKFYHIDMEEGLAALAAYIRKHNIYAVPVSPQEDYAASVYPGNQEGGVR